MQCKQKNTNCLPALKPSRNLPILGNGKIALRVILLHEAKQTLPSSFRSVNFQRVLEQELESLFGAEAGVKKVTPITSAAHQHPIPYHCRLQYVLTAWRLDSTLACISAVKFENCSRRFETEPLALAGSLLIV